MPQRKPQRKLSRSRAKKKAADTSPEHNVVVERHVVQDLNHSDLSSIPRDDAHDILAERVRVTSRREEIDLRVVHTLL